eukprot:432514-Alexandrium_andersonii.AAC.1
MGAIQRTTRLALYLPQALMQTEAIAMGLSLPTGGVSVSVLGMWVWRHKVRDPGQPHFSKTKKGQQGWTRS